MKCLRDVDNEAMEMLYGWIKFLRGAGCQVSFSCSRSYTKVVNVSLDSPNLDPVVPEAIYE